MIDENLVITRNLSITLSFLDKKNFKIFQESNYSNQLQLPAHIMRETLNGWIGSQTKMPPVPY